MRVHSVTQGQLRGAGAVLSTEVVRYRRIILGRVIESLQNQNKMPFLSRLFQTMEILSFYSGTYFALGTRMREKLYCEWMDTC